MARKKEYVRIRIETLENYIGFYEATFRLDVVMAFRRLAREIGAQLDEAHIEQAHDRTQSELSRSRKGASQ